MKTKFIILCLLFGILQSCSQSTKVSSKSIESVILEIITAYQTQDEKTLNRFIAKEVGFYTLFRRGATDTYWHSDDFQFEAPVPEYWPYENDLEIEKKIEFQALPKFDCDTENWSKKGIYYTKNSSKLLTETAKNLELFELKELTKVELEKLEFIENNSYQIIVVDKENIAFIFYLTQINNQFYLTLIDRVSYDCSA